MPYSDVQKRHTVALFRSKLNELKSSIEDPNDIQLINSARLIRDLLISDNNGIVGQLSRVVPGFRRRRNNALLFVAQVRMDSHHERIGEGDTDFRSKIVIPEQSSHGVRYRRDDFLRLPVVDIDHNMGLVTFTVRDIVKFFANKLGGVHLDYEKTGDPTDLLYTLWELSENEHMPNVIYTMKGIANIVINTCSEIDDRLKALNY